MNIGSMDGKMAHDVAAELATGMADRVRSAHRQAEVEPEASQIESGPPSPKRERAVDPVGAGLRTELEEIVADVVSAAPSEPDDLVGEVVDRVVADRIERGELEVDEDHQRKVADVMRRDPVVLAEIDDLLRDIARDLAFRGV